MYAKAAKFCSFIIRKKRPAEGDVNTSKYGVLYNTDISVKILCIPWSK